MAQSVITVRTTGPGLYDFTGKAGDFVAASGKGEGLLTCFVRHTSASLLIQENADRDVCRDLDDFFARLVPRGDHPSMSWLRHRSEGPDDMPAHIRSALTQVSLSIPVAEGRMRLGTWQGLYLFEHRDRGQPREIVLHLSA